MDNNYEFIEKDQEEKDIPFDHFNKNDNIEKINNEKFLEDISLACNEMQKNGYDIAKSFASDEFVGISEDAAEKLSAIIEDIKAANQERTIFDKAVSYLPTVLQNVIHRGKGEVTKSRITNNNIGKTTDEIFSQLDGQMDNLSKQRLAIAGMEENIVDIINNLKAMSDKLSKRYIQLVEEDFFEINNAKRLHFQFQSTINDVEMNIKTFEQRKMEIENAGIASEHTLRQVREEIPYLKQELLSGMATSIFIDKISKLQNTTMDLMDVVSEINLNNSEINKNALLNVTDTSKYSRKRLEVLEKQQRIKNETQKGISHNFNNAIKDVRTHNAKLIALNNADNEDESFLLANPDHVKRDIVDFSKVKSLSHVKNSKDKE